MEAVILLAVATIFLLFSIVRKIVARRKFRKAVAVYENSRRQHPAQDEIWKIPTVEDFLAERGQLYLLREINYPFAQKIETASTISNHKDDGLKDSSYETFVANMWALPGSDLYEIVVKRGHGTTSSSCRLHSLVEGEAGRLYINLFEDGVRKTYAADGRHRWFVDGEEIDYSAFIGIRRGADPRIVLRPEQYPASFEEAMSEHFDRFQTENPKFAIAYQSLRGLSYRVISRVIRNDETFSARCHLRWGERRTFRKASLIAVFDVQAGEIVEVQTFLRKRTRA